MMSFVLIDGPNDVCLDEGFLVAQETFKTFYMCLCDEHKIYVGGGCIAVTSSTPGSKTQRVFSLKWRGTLLCELRFHFLLLHTEGKEN